MIDLGSLVLKLAGDMAPLAQTLQRAEQETSGFAGRLSQKLAAAGQSFMKIGAGMTAGITAPIVAAGLKAVDAASGMNETVSKIGVVFGQNAAEVEAWGNTTAKAIGQSKQQALEAAGTYGNLFTSMGMGKQVSAEMSMGLVTLASDLASFNNIDPSVALEKLRAGLTGETEPLKTLGINLSATAIQAEAFRLGLAKSDVDMRKVELATNAVSRAQAALAETTKKHGAGSQEAAKARDALTRAEMGVETAMKGSKTELDAAAKAQAAYSLIMQQSKNAQGDFARTSDGLANQTRILKAQLADAAAKMGENLLPIALKIVTAVNGLIEKFTNLSPAVRTTITIVAGIAAAIGPVLVAVGSFMTGIGGIIANAGKLKTVLAGVGTAFRLLTGPVGWAIAAAGLLAVAWKTDFLGLRTTVTSTIQRVGSTVNQLGVIFNTAKQKTGSTVEAVKYTIGALGDLAPGLKPVTKAVVGVITTFQQEWPKAKKAVEDWWAGARPKLEEAWGTIKNKVGGAVKDVRAWFDENWPKAKKAVEDWWGGAKPKLEEAWGTIKNKVGGAVKDVRAWFDENWPKAKTAVENFWAGAKPKLEQAWETIKTKVGGAVKDVKGWFEENWPKAKTAVETFWTGAKPKLEEAWTTIKDKVGGAVKDVKGWFEENWPKAKTAVEEFWAGAKPKLEEADTWISSKLKTAVSDVGKFFEENWPKAKAAVEDWWTGTKPKLEEAVDWIKTKTGDAVKDLATWFEENWPKMKTSVNDWWTGVKDGLESAHTFFSKTLPDAIETLKEKLKPLADAWESYKTVLGQVNDLFKAFQDVLDAIKDKAAEWGQYIFDMLKTKLEEQGKYLNETFGPAWKTIKETFEKIAEIVNTAVKTAFGDIGTKMDEVRPAADLFAGAMNAIKGAIDGIGSAISGAIGWLESLAEKIRNLPSPPPIFTPHSPTPFEMGIRGIGAAAEVVASSSIPALADALTTNFAAAAPPVQNFLDLIQQLIGMSGDQLGVLGEKLKGVGEGMKAMVEALTDASAYHAGNVIRNWAALRADMEYVIEQLFQLAELYASGHKHISAKAFTDAVQGSFGAVKSIVEALVAVSDYESASDLVGRMTRMSLDVQTVIDELFKLAELYAGTKHAPDPTAIMALTAPVQAIAEVLESLRGIATYRGATNIAARVAALVADVDAVITELARLGPTMPLDDAQAALQNFGEKLSGLVKPFEEAIGFWGEIKEMAESGGGPYVATFIYELLKSLLDELGLVAMVLAEAKNDPRLNLVDQALSDFAERIGGLTGPFQESLSFWREMDDLSRSGIYVQPGTDTYYTLTQLMFQAAMLATALEAAAMDPRLQGITDYMVQLGERISSIVAPFSAMLGFWRSLQENADLGAPADDKLRTIAGRIIDQLGILAEELATAVSSTGDWGLASVNDNMVQFAQRLSGLTAPFEAMLSFWSQLNETAEGAAPADDALRATIKRILEGYNIISQEIIGALSTTGGGPLMAIDQFMIDLAGRMGELGQALGQALEFLTNLGAWQATDNLAVQFTDFIGAWKDILTQIVDARLETTIVVNDDLRRLVRAAGELGEGLTKALDFLTALGVWEAAPDLADRAKLLATALQDVLDQLKPIVNTWSSDGLKLANDFGQAVGSVMGGLKSALDLALALPATWTAPSAAVWDAFFGWATGVFASFVQKVKEWTGKQEGVTGILSPDDATVVGQIAGAFGSVMSALKSALDLAIAVPAQWTLPDAAVFDAFLSWAEDVFAAFVAKVQEWTGTQTGAAVAVAPLMTGDDSTVVGQIAGAFGSVMSALKSALDLAIAVPAKWVLPDAAVFNEFITWATGVFATFATKVQEWAAQQSNPADQATLVGTVAGAFGSVMQGLASALDVLNGLVWYVGPAESRITAFLDGVKLVFANMATYAQGALTEAQATATKTFSDVMGGLFGALQSALGLLETLDKFAIDPSEQGSFAHKVQMFNEALSLAISSWQEWIVDDLDPDAAKLVADFSGVLGTIAQGFRDALDMLTSLNEAGLPTMDKLDKALALILKIFGDFSTELAAAVKPAEWEAIGKGMIDGLISGIEKERQKLIDAAKSASYDAYLAVKQALGIASPSKLFAGLGVQLPAGLAQGIVKGAPVVRKALGSLYAQAGLGNVEVGTHSRQDIYLHGDGMSGLSASERRSVIDDLARSLRLQGLRVGVA